MILKVKIEIPKGSNIKYEFNKKTGVIEVDRVLKLKYPFNYGFIQDTLWHDGDALDAFVVGEFQLHPGVEILVEPIGIFRMTDNGHSDDKVLCVLPGEAIDQKQLAAVSKFLQTYKSGVVISGYTASSEDMAKTLETAFKLAKEVA